MLQFEIMIFELCASAAPFAKIETVGVPLILSSGPTLHRSTNKLVTPELIVIIPMEGATVGCGTNAPALVKVAPLKFT
ncbi:MAG: hypothetical protein BWY47_00230 [Bacteroidetes bacterium ADurb.Bin302]|nr:MAG: hypothetical protein BWY47_00230 [Bacteroidetes bacterium ADurb.Bin302]